jgi:hypothetical protein
VKKQEENTWDVKIFFAALSFSSPVSPANAAFLLLFSGKISIASHLITKTHKYVARGHFIEQK